MLERDVEARWRSRYVAEQTNDWHTHGFNWHKKKLNKMDIPSMNVSESEEFCMRVKWNQMCHFERKHKEWFQFVREKVTRDNMVEVSFDDVVHDRGVESQRKISSALPMAFRFLVANGVE